MYFFHAGDQNTKICGATRLQCVKIAQSKLFTTQNGKAFRDGCNCLPSCTFVTFNAEINRMKLNLQKFKLKECVK